jgi:hypothetical protein
MGLLHLLKGKLLVVFLAGVAVVGGGVAFAATPAGQQALHTITASAHASVTPGAAGQDHRNQNNACAGQADAQRLAAQFALSAASDSDAVQAICALHAGTFKGTIPGGSAVSSSRVFGYGEIEQLLTYSQYLASHDQSNQDGKLTTANARGYLAEALQNCGTTPLETCLQAKIPGYHPGNGNGGGKPTSTPTPPGNGGGKPTSTPTPHH